MGSCGTCEAFGANAQCVNGSCTCTPNCTNKHCGDDNGCNGTCEGDKWCPTVYKCDTRCPTTQYPDGTCASTYIRNNQMVGSGWHMYTQRAASSCQYTGNPDHPSGFYCGGTQIAVQGESEYVWEDIDDCGETSIDNGTFCVQGNPTRSTTTHGCDLGGAASVGTNGAVCTTHNYAGAVDLCGLYGSTTSTCNGNNIRITDTNYVCAADSFNKTAACVPGGQSITELPCTGPSTSTYTFCSKGVECTATTNTLGGCEQMPTGARCRSGVDFNIVCSGPCDDGTTPSGCSEGDTQSCEGGGTQTCDPSGGWGECVCPEGQNSPSYQCIAGACSLADVCGKTSGDCNTASCNTIETTPKASLLAAAAAPYCETPDGAGIATFSWNFITASTGSAQTAWELQISTNSSFSKIIFDSGKQNGTANQAQFPVLLSTVKSTSTDACVSTQSCNFINYGVTYYWRVKVWDGSKASAWQNGDNFLYPHAHPAPIITYSVPDNVFKNTKAIFQDMSICYHDDGSQYYCKDLLVNSTAPASLSSILCKGVDYNIDGTKYCYGWWLNNNYSATTTPNKVDLGVVTVTATAADGSGVVGTKQIVITAAEPASSSSSDLVSSIVVTSEGAVSGIPTGQSLQMYATVLPNSAANKTVTWSAANGTGAATISSTGLLSATSAGTVTVRATANDGSNVYGTQTLTITQTASGGGAVTGISVVSAGAATSVASGDTLQMNAIITPSNATDTSVTWSVTPSTYSTVAVTIDASTGLLTAGAIGQASYTYTSTGVKTTTLQVCDEIGCCTGTKDVTVQLKPPTATSLFVTDRTGYYCTSSSMPGGGYLTYLNWTYNGGTGTSTVYNQQKYQLQISTTSDFSDMVYDSGQKTGITSNGGIYRTVIWVYPSSYTDVDSTTKVHIHYGQSYYWRVKVQEKTTNQWSDWYYYTDENGYVVTYTYPYPHQAPTVSAVANPTSAKTGETINFTDTSYCYDTAGTQYLCEDLDNVTYKWDFKDGSTVYTSDSSGNTSHAYFPDSTKTYPATYSPSLSVCDVGDTCCKASVPVTIGENAPPTIPDETITVGTPPTTITIGTPIVPNQLSVSDTAYYCSGANLATFRWGYADTEKDVETGWQLQISTAYSATDEGVFTSGIVFDDTQSYSGSNADTVPVSYDTCNGTSGHNCINYGKTYYIRVRVTELEAGTANYQNSNWYYYGNAGTPMTYTYPFPHPGPVLSYKYAAQGLSATFEDTSRCYGTLGAEYSCKTNTANTIEWSYENGSYTSAKTHTFASVDSTSVAERVCDDVGCCIAPSNVLLTEESGVLPLWKEISPFK